MAGNNIFLIGEYMMPEAESSPVFTVADGILWLSQNLQHSSMVRKIQVVKMRGQAQVPGLHTFRISDAGIQVFPACDCPIGRSGWFSTQAIHCNRTRGDGNTWPG
ncbi:ATPase domain-containing protein [Undibacterium arcticum]